MMKKLLVLLSFPTIVLVSCSGKNTYTVETFYTNNNGKNGDTLLVSNKDNLSADNDSTAFVKAQAKFNTLMSKSGDKHGLPVKFTVRNHDGVIVVAPGQSIMQQDRNMYPNQKSPD